MRHIQNWVPNQEEETVVTALLPIVVGKNRTFIYERRKETMIVSKFTNEAVGRKRIRLQMDM